MIIKAGDIRPGNILSLDPGADYITEANRSLAENEYTRIDHVNGGWVDDVAGAGELVLYSAENLAEPVVIGAHELVELYVPEDVAERLEYLRGEIEAERISQGEIAELQDLAGYIAPDDVQLLEWAGVPEQ